MTEPGFWEAAGGEVAEALDGLHAIVVVGDDPHQAAEAALGIARVQARRRRVAVADLAGELPELERLLPAPAEHGIVDSFTYGVSLSQIAQPVDAAKNLFILPSGATPIDHATILPSVRWQRLAGGFREVNALLLAVVPFEAPGLTSLLSGFDGHVAVGGVEVAPPHTLITRVTGREKLTVPSTPEKTKADEWRDTSEELTAPPENSRWSFGRPRVPIFATAAALIILAAITALLLNPTRSREPVPAETPLVADTGDDVAAEAAGAAAAPADTLPLVTVANPSDSSNATAYSVQLASHTGMTSALAHVITAADRAMPAVTFSPVITGPANARWYRVLAGAYGDPVSADSLLALLRRRGSLEAAQGEVRHAPFALLVERGVAREQTDIYVRDYRDRGLPAYGLLQTDGTVNIYTGAFETPEQAAVLLAILRERGETPQVVYRLGRAF